jgi:hypothetical protein
VSTYRPGQPPTDIAGLIAELEEVDRRLRVLERPSGEQLAQVVEELQAWVADIQAQLDDYLANDAYTKAQVDARVIDPGLVGNVSTGASARYNGGIASTDSYGRLLTYGGAYRALWVHIDGSYGYVPSSRKFKTDIAPASFTVDEVLQLQAFFFRYLAPAPYDQAQQRVMLGLLAEDTHAAGFHWLVDYDENGEPFGIRGDVLGLVLLEGFRSLVAEVRGIPSGA